MSYEIQTADSIITLPDSLTGELGDGVYLFTFTRNWFGTEGAINESFIGQDIVQNGITFRILQITRINTDTIVLKIAVLSGAVPIAALVLWTLAAGVVLGLVGWSLNSVAKIADLSSSTEICYDRNGNAQLCRKGLLDQIKTLFGATAGLLIVGTLVYFVWKNRKN